MQFLQPPGSRESRSLSQTNFIIEEDSRSDTSELPSSFPGARGIAESVQNFVPTKWIATFFALTTLALVITTAGFGFLYFETLPRHKTCHSSKCTKTATLLLRTMDESVDPCEDFHKFACGNWISDTAAVVSLSQYDHTTIMRDRIVGRLRSLTENISNSDISPLQQLRIMYNTCVDLVRIEDAGNQPLEELIRRLILPDWSLPRTLATIHKETSQDYIFDMNIEPSFLNTRRKIISIDAPMLPLQKASFMYSSASVEGYKKLIQKVFEKLQGLPLISDFEKDAEEVVAFEKELAMAVTDQEFNGKALTANVYTLNDLNQLFGNEAPKTASTVFNWTEYIEVLFENIADVDISQEFKLNIVDAPYLKKLASVFAKSELRNLKLYVMWQLLYTFGKDVTKDVKNYFSAFSVISQGTDNNPNRHTECILLLDQSLPFAVTYKYISTFVQDSTIKEAREMFQNVLRAFKHQILKLSWMDTGTKLRALQKANRVEGFLGYPEWLRDPEAVERYYDGLNFTDDSFFDNLLIMMKWISKKDLMDFINEPVDSSWVSDSPAQADAFYDDERNAVTLPSGFLQEPFIGMGLKAIDYGALGSVIGHELTHGFDTMGRYNDAWGRLSSWWSLDTLMLFNKKAQCFVDQYDKYWFPELGTTSGPNNTVNGRRTLAENIADNGGIREAYHAYSLYVREHGQEFRLPGLEKYTPEQLFFLSFAQSWCSYLSPAALTEMIETNVHTPPKYRILGPLQNFQEFSKVWDCSTDSFMNPSQKCVLWG